MCMQVLIVGGGDSGAVREIAKHPEVQEIHQCEIDEVSLFILPDRILVLECSGYCVCMLALPVTVYDHQCIQYWHTVKVVQLNKL